MDSCACCGHCATHNIGILRLQSHRRHHTGAEEEMEGIMLVAKGTDSRDPARRGRVRTTEESSEGSKEPKLVTVTGDLSFNHWHN